MTPKPHYSWIVGASSGIGRAVAKELASQGETLALSARNEEQLKRLAAELGRDNHLVLPLDVSDAASVSAAVERLKDEWARIDRALFFSGVYTPTELSNLDLEDVKQTLDVNLFGAFAFVDAVLPVLKSQNSGQLALCGSVAGYRGLPKGQPYSATKAGIINLAQSLRAEVDRSIDVKLINPGYVDTRLTRQNTHKMPALISTDEAAGAVVKGLDSTAFEIHFPKRFTLMMKLLSLLPDFLYFRMVS